MNRATDQEDTMTVAERIFQTAETYDVPEAEAAAWALERAEKAERDARRLVTVRTRKVREQREVFARVCDRLDPYAEGIQTGALANRENALARAVAALAAAAHVLAETEAAL